MSNASAKEVIAAAAAESTNARGDGDLHAADLVAAAKNPKHPLHKHFIWSDEQAAAEYRLQQACTMIESL